MKKYIIDVDALVEEYKKAKGIYGEGNEIHFLNGINAILDIKKECVFTTENMKKCFNDSRKAYFFKNGTPSVHANFSSYIKTFSKTKKND